MRQAIRRFIGEDPSLLFRGYFVNTLFDSTFVVLGILAAAAFSADLRSAVALDVLLAACLAIGISTGVSVYEAEHTEGEIRMRRLERAMLSRLEGTEVDRSMRASRLARSLVNFAAPLLVAGITGLPLLLRGAGAIPDFVVAASLSAAAGIGIIFAAGYYVGRLSALRPWAKAVRMATVALLTFGALALLERLT